MKSIDPVSLPPFRGCPSEGEFDLLWTEWRRLDAARSGDQPDDDEADTADNEQTAIEMRMIVTPATMQYHVAQKLKVARTIMEAGTSTRHLEDMLIASAICDLEGGAL